jgi:hypothetical protein
MSQTMLKGVTTSKEVVGNNGQVQAAGTRWGFAYEMDWIAAMALEGRLFWTSRAEALVTPVAGRATILALQPELVIDVPAGTSIIPIQIACQVEVAAGTLNEFFAISSRAVRGAGTSTLGAAINVRGDAPVASACTVYHTYSANAAATASPIYFFRAGYPFAHATTDPLLKWVYSIREHTPMVIVGPGSISVHFGSGAGGAPTGFITASWVEVPSSTI